MEKSAKFIEDIREGHRRNDRALEKYFHAMPKKAQPQKANEAQETQST